MRFPWFGLVGLIAAAIVLSGCVSSDRMMKNSPFEESVQQNLSGNQVNLWPLAYRSGDSTSVLWPLIDFDANGFAVRPFLHRDGEDWGILWPLSGWNRHAGWATLYFWGEDYQGAFPLFFAGTDWKIFGPFWHYRKAEKASGGFFPLARFSGGFNYVVNAWWDRGDQTYGFFPLAGFHQNTNYVLPVFWGKDYCLIFPAAYFSDQFNFAGPAWWDRRDRTCGFFPLAGFYRENSYVLPVFWSRDYFLALPVVMLSDEFNFAGPVWWVKEDGVRTSRGLFPVIYDFRDTTIVGPVWWHRKEEKLASYGCWPLARFGEESTYVIPVLWSKELKAVLPACAWGPDYFFSAPVSFGTNGEGRFDWFNLGLLLYHFDRREDGGAVHDCLFPLVKFETGVDTPDWRVWPLAVRSRESAFPAVVNMHPHEFNILGPLVYDQTELDFTADRTDRFRFRTGTPLTGLLEEPNRRLTSRIRLALLGAWVATDSRHQVWNFPDKKQDDYRQLFLLLERAQALAAPVADDAGSEAAAQAAARSERQLAKVAEQLKKMGIDLKAEKPADLDAVYDFLASNYAVEKDASTFALGLAALYVKATYGDDFIRAVLLGLISQRKIGDSEDFRILGYLYRAERSGAEWRKTVFPFITVEGGGRRSGWSFLWRVLERHEEDGKTGGHVFFIPYGD